MARSRKEPPALRDLRPSPSRLRGKRVALVASRFNAAITSALVEGARAALEQAGIARHAIQTVWVPGAFELPVMAAAVIAAQRPDAVVALGCLIKGETPQYAAIGEAVAQGLTQVALAGHVPVTFGVVIAETAGQARARAGLAGRQGNRGADAAFAAVAMIAQLDQLTVASRNGVRR